MRALAPLRIRTGDMTGSRRTDRDDLEAQTLEQLVPPTPSCRRPATISASAIVPADSNSLSLSDQCRLLRQAILAVQVVLALRCQRGAVVLVRGERWRSSAATLKCLPIAGAHHRSRVGVAAEAGMRALPCLIGEYLSSRNRC